MDYRYCQHRCILCESGHIVSYHEDKRRSYLKCENCCLIFVPSVFRLSAGEEKRRYDLHENDPSDPGYRKFLSRLLKPMNALLDEQSRGLDFGSGPGPTLGRMFEENGHKMDLYDPFYADRPEVFSKKYDFITASEVVEHLYNPARELNRLWDCLKSGGYLGIMTKRADEKESFEQWHYIRDETHVAFYSEETFRWLAGRGRAKVRFPREDVAIFYKE